MNFARFLPKRRQLTRAERDKRDNKQFSALSHFMSGAILGFWGSLMLALTWLFAPIIGWLLWKDLPNRVGRSILLTTLGVFLGGLPYWFWAACMATSSWQLRILLICSTPLLFLAGATPVVVIAAIRHARNTASGGGSTPPNSGQSPTQRHWWNRKPTWQRSNRHPLASVQF